ncbi:Uncharacterised protein [uncultured archaeon]|nr:Uncharacterised protein [uncultured archaeon]
MGRSKRNHLVLWKVFHIKLTKRSVKLLFFRRPAVPAGLPFHERDALALHCVGDYHCGLALCFLRFLECSDERFHAVAVADYYVPAKGMVFLINRVDAHDILHRAVDLQLVLVHYANEVVELVVRGGHCGLPYLPFLLLAVAHYAINAIVFLV